MGAALAGLGMLLAAGSALLAGAAGVWTREPLTGVVLGAVMAVIGLLTWLN